MPDVYPFRFALPYRLAAMPFGVRPATSRVVVDDHTFAVDFGRWKLRSPLDNVVGVEVTGPYSLAKTAGPAHLSFTDRGITFATNGDRGVCVRFRDPVPAMEPTGRLRHPGATVTVADVDGLAAALRELTATR
jgi:hypothetical protein